MHPLILFVIIFFSTIFVIGLFVATWFISKSRVKNKPENAIVLVKSGQEILPYKGKQNGKPSNKATRYDYNKDNFVLVPNKYNPDFIKNKRLIFVSRQGQVVASPFDKVQSLTSTEREKLIYEFVESKIGGEAIREIKGKSAVNVIFIAVVAFVVGIACVFLFNFVRDNYGQTEQSVQTEQPKITEEYKPISEEK